MSLLDDLRDERKRYGATMNDNECADLCNAVAWKNRADGWGLNHKDSGTHGRRFDGVRVAHDILHNRHTNMLVDCLTAAGAASTPVWNELGPNGNTSRPWVAPVAPQGREEPSPEPTPEPGPSPGSSPEPCRFQATDLSSILARLSALEQRAGRIESHADNAANDARNAALEAQGIRDRLDRGFTVSIRAGFLGTLHGDIAVKKE